MSHCCKSMLNLIITFTTMNKKQFFRRMMVALVILLGVQVSASAQFGGLKKAADKAKKTATEKVKKAKDAVTGTTSQSNSSYQEYEDGGYSNDGGMTVMGGSGSRDAEFNRVKKAGGWDKYLELDKTANGRVMYKYFEAPGYEEFPSNMCLNGAKQATALICQVIRYMKGEREHYGEYSSKVYGEDKLKNAKEYIERSQVKKGKEDEPIAKADADALMAEWERVNAEYHAFLAKNEKPVSQEQVNAAYDDYAKGVKRNNYWLDELGDDKDSKGFPDKETYRKQVNDLVNKLYSPTKILGTYMAQSGWTGVPTGSGPSLKGVYFSASQLLFRCYYEKDGKYYVVESAFRKGLKLSEQVGSGEKPIDNCWPGVIMPVEIPANVIKKYL